MRTRLPHSCIETGAVPDLAKCRNTTIEDALRDAEVALPRPTPRVLRTINAAQAHLPGGNTRTNMYFSPFPLTIMRGEGARLYDLDGHAYLDFLGEYTAGIFGHSDGRIRAAIIEALDAGINLGGPNQWEAELGRLMCERFPSLDKVRFCNSGTEANLYAISAARASTGRTHVMVFDGAYHGGVLSFVKPSPMTAPFPYILAQYNDLEGTAALISRHQDELAAVLLEPMIGSGGGISADREFLAMLRDETRRHGIILIFDEVMTSRLSPGGLQEKLGIVPGHDELREISRRRSQLRRVRRERRNHAPLRPVRDRRLRPFRHVQQQHAHDGCRRRGTSRDLHPGSRRQPQRAGRSSAGEDERRFPPARGGDADAWAGFAQCHPRPWTPSPAAGGRRQ